MEGGNFRLSTSTWIPDYLVPQVDDWDSCYLPTNQSEEGHTPCRPPPKLLLLKLFPENYWGVQVFWAWASPFISPLQTSTFQFAWPHCALNTQTGFRQEKKKKRCNRQCWTLMVQITVWLKRCPWDEILGKAINHGDEWKNRKIKRYSENFNLITSTSHKYSAWLSTK